MNTLTEIHHITAGNIARVSTVFERPEGSLINVNPSTAVMTVKDVNGVIVTLTPLISYAADGTSLTVVAEWVIPDTQAAGYYKVRTDVSGSLVAFRKETIYVEAQG